MKGARHRRLTELLRERGEITVKELAVTFEVSEATIRRDLQDLRGSQGLERMHGGVAFNSDSEPPVMSRRRENADVKAALARRAAEEISNGATIFIGSGSTMASLAESLHDRTDLTVITNAHNVASELSSAPGVAVIMTGGALRPGEMSLIGPIAEDTLRRVRVETAFISVHGITAKEGLTNTFAPEAQTDSVVVEVAPRLIVVAEARKVGNVAPIPIGTLQDADLVISDADDQRLDQLRSAGVAIAQVERLLEGQK